MPVPHFSPQEKEWLKAYLSYDFPGREEIIQQIKTSTVTREYTKWHLSMKFHPYRGTSPTPSTQRVPFVMLAHLEDRAPLEFLLHIVDGYVAELEILFADSSEISDSVDIADAKLEYFI